MKNRISAWIVLGIITIAAGLSLAVTNEVTKGPIAEQAVLSEEKARTQVMPGAERFEEITLDDGQVLYAAISGGNTVGFVGKAERKGYGGTVEIIAGVDAEGTVTGINVGGSGFSETPGLGAKAKDPSFTGQFAGKKTPVRIGDPSSDTGIDAITAATITSSAVVGGVNQIAKQVSNYLNPQSGEGPVITAEGTSYGAAADGFAGPVAVIVTVKDDGTISALKVGDDRFSETDGYGANALAPEFAAQFVGKSLPVSLDDIEAVSGASVTTGAVLEAINKAYDEKNIVATAAALPEGTTYAGEVEGFAGPVAVLVTVKDDGTISALTVGDDRFGETEGYGANALAPEFAAQFAGKALPMQLADIEAVSGATITSTAVVEAINKAFNEKNAVGEPQAPAATEMIAAETTPVPTEEPAAVPEDAVTVSKDGYAGPVSVTLGFSRDGSISFIAIGDGGFSETPGLGAKALEREFQQQFIGKLPPLRIKAADEAQAPDNFDAIAGATITSQAVRDAINEAHAGLFPVSAATEEPLPTAALDAGLSASLSKEGFMGPVAVQVSFNGDGTISEVLVGDGQFAETEGYGAAALEESFSSSLIGKLPPLNIRGQGEAASIGNVDKIVNIDSVTSSTVTTQAILDAINEAHATLFHTQAPVSDEDGTANDVTVVKQGFLGPVAVTVSFSPEGAVSHIKIGDDAFAESQGYGAGALSEQFTGQFIGKKPPLKIRGNGEAPSADTIEKITDPDAVTSATVTTQAIVDAVNEAFGSKP